MADDHSQKVAFDAISYGISQDSFVAVIILSFFVYFVVPKSLTDEQQADPIFAVVPETDHRVIILEPRLGSICDLYSDRSKILCEIKESLESSGVKVIVDDLSKKCLKSDNCHVGSDGSVNDAGLYCPSVRIEKAASDSELLSSLESRCPSAKMTSSEASDDQGCYCPLSRSSTSDTTQVQIDFKNGTLRPMGAVFFKVSEHQITSNGSRAVKMIAKAMEDVLPGYVKMNVSQDYEASDIKLGTILIEGHADCLEFCSDFGDVDDRSAEKNLILSQNRARSAYHYIMGISRELGRMVNDSGNKVFGVAGCGNRCPTQEGGIRCCHRDRDADRRVEFRFIMSHSSSMP